MSSFLGLNAELALRKKPWQLQRRPVSGIALRYARERTTVRGTVDRTCPLKTILALTVSLLLGWKYGDLITAITIIATAITIVVIAVYIVVCMSTIVYFARRPERTPWLHWLVPILGAAAFIPPLYYQYFPLPAYPLRYGAWIALGRIAVESSSPLWIVDNPDQLFLEEAPVGVRTLGAARDRAGARAGMSTDLLTGRDQTRLVVVDGALHAGRGAPPSAGCRRRVLRPRLLIRGDRSSRGSRGPGRGGRRELRERSISRRKRRGVVVPRATHPRRGRPNTSRTRLGVRGLLDVLPSPSVWLRYRAWRDWWGLGATLGRLS